MSLPIFAYAQDAEYGKASYYSDRFHGRTTASGEYYFTDSLTAAHQTLPFGSIVKVTNIKNERSVVVRINDRGPFIKGRIIDLSKRAMQQLKGLEAGIIEVKIEPITSD